jgi:hypothetical protein
MYTRTHVRQYHELPAILYNNESIEILIFPIFKAWIDESLCIIFDMLVLGSEP